MLSFSATSPRCGGSPTDEQDTSDLCSGYVVRNGPGTSMSTFPSLCKTSCAKPRLLAEQSGPVLVPSRQHKRLTASSVAKHRALHPEPREPRKLLLRKRMPRIVLVMILRWKRGVQKKKMPSSSKTATGGPNSSRKQQQQKAKQGLLLQRCRTETPPREPGSNRACKMSVPLTQGCPE